MASFCVNLEPNHLHGMNEVHNMDVCLPPNHPDYDNQHALEAEDWNAAMRETLTMGLKAGKCACSGCKGTY